VENRRRWELFGRVFMCLWVLFALPTEVQLVRAADPSAYAGALAFLVWGIVWVWYWLRILGRDHTGEVVAFIGSTVILGIAAAISPSPAGAGGILVFAFIMAGACFPWRTAVWVLLGLTLFQAAAQAARFEDPGQQVSSLLNSVLVGGVGIGARLLWTAYSDLTEAREEIARLAVSEERLRFARDVHDLLGQSLATIVLKSELIGRQLPADADEPLKHEVDDVAAVARKSLHDLRDAVAGYRRPTLPAEISSARAALRSAGIGFAVDDRAGEVASDKDEVLAWCVREAVTNVVKHSGATRCSVELSRDDGLLRLSVEDDGRGASSLDGGSGLAGMRERVAIAGGTFEVRNGSRRGVKVKVAIPA
jgi:two-component system, NarL family, sensor histidine kinase DesK